MKDNLGHGSDARGGSRSYGGLSRQKYIPAQPATQSEYTPDSGVAGTYARFGQEMKRLQAGVAGRGSVRRQNRKAAAALGGGHPKAGRVSTHPGMVTQAFRSARAAFRKYDG